MKFLASAALVASLCASFVLAIDPRVQLNTLSVFCNTWAYECAVQVGFITGPEGGLEAFCEQGYLGNGTAEVFCTYSFNGVVNDYTQQVIEILNATLASD